MSVESTRRSHQAATEIRVRAQRRAGEMLALTPNATGTLKVGRAVPASDHGVPTMAATGITKNQSATWQALATMNTEAGHAVVNVV